MRAPRSGRYRLQAQRIGYETATSPLLSVGRDTLAYAFDIAVSPEQLPSIEAASRDRGCARRADGPAVAALWSEIQKVLNVTAWTEQFGNVHYVVRVYRMTADPERQLVFDEERRTHAARSLLPFSTATPAHLAELGFSRPEDDHLVLHGPDATVLMSDEFLDGHCFRLAVNRQAPELIGLSFEPMRRRRDITDIAGVLWVDRASAALRRLEYSYTNLPARYAANPSGGQLEFRRLENGLWIVQSWSIRSPALVMGTDPRGRPEVRRGGFLEYGGIVLRANDRGRPLYGLAGDAVIEGFVRDGPDGEPLSGARVFLTGTGHEALTDEQGRFRIEQVPAGRYGISFSHGLNEELALPVALDSVYVAPGVLARHDLSLPGLADKLRTLCPGQAEERGSPGLVYGVVTDSAGVAVARAELRASWRGHRPGGGVVVDRWRTAGTDHRGRY